MHLLTIDFKVCSLMFLSINNADCTMAIYNTKNRLIFRNAKTYFNHLQQYQIDTYLLNH